jgi:Family of unknown function (DUF6317)
MVRVDLGGGASDGFQVVLSDLATAAQTFHTEAGTFKAIMPGASGPPVPDSGSGAFNGMCQAVVDAIWTLHLVIGGDIDEHGTKLRRAHDNYQHTDGSVAAVANQLTGSGSAG